MHTDPPVFPGRIDPGQRFRERRRRARRRRRIRRLGLFAVLVSAAVALALNASLGGGNGPSGGTTAAGATTQAVKVISDSSSTRVPDEIRGVHITIGLASLPGKLDQYIGLKAAGLNTIELDVKDEDGKVGFVTPAVPLARAVGAQSSRYYDARRVARRVHAAGLYLVGRVVVFQDSILTKARPALGIRTPGGSVWTTSAGEAWANPYDRRVWKYNVDIAVAAAKAGFDEIVFDYMRFPTDGDVARAVYPNRTAESRGQVIADFVTYASSRLRPLGVRVGASLFGLSATHHLGIGQKPRLLGDDLDVIYPMVYPALYGSGQYNIEDPAAEPGRTVSFALLDFRRKLEGKKAQLVPWLEDWSPPGKTYTLADVEQQIDAARRARTGGFLLWNPYGEYSKGALAAR